MFALPVCGVRVALKLPDGVDDLRLAEARGEATEVALTLIDALSQGAIDTRQLVVTDFEWLLMQMRAERFGRKVALGFACPHCAARAEIEFRVEDCLEAATPQQVAGVEDDAERPGWRRLGAIRFRLPTAGDQVAVLRTARPTEKLAELCLDEAARRAPHRARAERAMAAMAPLVSRSLPGACPACKADVLVAFHVASVVVSEWRRAAATAHEEIDLIARAYHWSEAEILALPQPRRRAYAERIRSAGVRAA
jgi:hypothetical protein